MFSFRNDIQAYRALAVLLVIVAHLHPIIFENWVVGVDLFFVISGFVITQSILNTFFSSRFNLKVFYAKRIIRIFPLTVLSALLIFLVFRIISPSTFNSLEFLTATFGIQNLVLYFKNITYGGIPASYNPFTHFWSLGIEEQFYFVYPLLFVFITKLFKYKSNQQSIKRFGLFLIFFALLSFAYYISGIENNRLLYYSPFARAWELLLGCISAVSLRLYNKNFLSDSYLKLSLALKFLFIVPLLLLTFDLGYYYLNLTILLISFSSILFIDAFSVKANQHIKNNSVFVVPQKIILGIGNSSFSAYIIHWPLLLIFKVFFIFHGNYFIFDLSYLASLFVLTSFSYFFVEKKFTLDSNYKFSIKPFYLYFSSLISAAIIFVPSIYSKQLKKYFRPLNPDGFYYSSSFIDEKTKPGSLPCSWGYSDSFTNELDKTRLKDCLNSQIDNQNRPTVFLIGDSHSTSLSTSAKSFASYFKYNYVKAAHVYCPFRKLYTMNWKLSTTVSDFSCSNFNIGVENYLIKNAKKGDMVILSSRDSFYFSDVVPISNEHKKDFYDGFTKYFDVSGNLISRRVVAHDMLAGINSLNDSLSSIGTNLVVVLQGHENKNNIFYCDHRFSSYRSDCLVSKKDFLNHKRSYFREHLISHYSHLNYIDLLSSTCKNDDCYSMDSNGYIFRDDDHITASFADKHVTPQLINLIQN